VDIVLNAVDAYSVILITTSTCPRAVCTHSTFITVVSHVPALKFEDIHRVLIVEKQFPVSPPHITALLSDLAKVLVFLQKRIVKKRDKVQRAVHE